MSVFYIRLVTWKFLNFGKFWNSKIRTFCTDFVLMMKISPTVFLFYLNSKLDLGVNIFPVFYYSLWMIPGTDALLFFNFFLGILTFFSVISYNWLFLLLLVSSMSNHSYVSFIKWSVHYFNVMLPTYLYEFLRVSFLCFYRFHDYLLLFIKILLHPSQFFLPSILSYINNVSIKLVSY